jgi:hypothetical protein
MKQSKPICAVCMTEIEDDTFSVNIQTNKAHTYCYKFFEEPELAESFNDLLGKIKLPENKNNDRDYSKILQEVIANHINDNTKCSIVQDFNALIIAYEIKESEERFASAYCGWGE